MVSDLEASLVEILPDNVLTLECDSEFFFLPAEVLEICLNLELEFRHLLDDVCSIVFYNFCYSSPVWNVCKTLLHKSNFISMTLLLLKARDFPRKRDVCLYNVD